ncbi:hypothetical protein K435DRAFT_880515 [Dendrothele bispora CBS 962.96]|uniref:Uncharacterized protein n=1 Tax=Dendrothele bispora (strain CBS 962.96) TaxID=1314807 RepID=A0A4S8KJH6_DENBC|nr:hypothetical protein K435DRAFT_880515 [Dendrothele bispora CBS 962.96]
MPMTRRSLTIPALTAHSGLLTAITLLINLPREVPKHVADLGPRANVTST